MNIERFVKSPYRALVMVIITTFFCFFWWELVSHLWYIIPEELGATTRGDLWLVPAVILNYVWSSATTVSFVMIFLDRPLKGPNENGLICGLTKGLITGLIWGLMWVLISGLWGLITGLILGFLCFLILGLIREFKKPREKPREITNTSTTG